MAEALLQFASMEPGMAPALLCFVSGVRAQSVGARREASAYDRASASVGMVATLVGAMQEQGTRAERTAARVRELQQAHGGVTQPSALMALFTWSTTPPTPPPPPLTEELHRQRCHQEQQRLAEIVQGLTGTEAEWVQREAQVEFRALLQNWTRAMVDGRAESVASWDRVLEGLDAPLDQW